MNWIIGSKMSRTRTHYHRNVDAEVSPQNELFSTLIWLRLALLHSDLPHTFVSDVFEGSISDVEIVKQSGLLEKFVTTL